jgi:hypothetical protein
MAAAKAGRRVFSAPPPLLQPAPRLRIPRRVRTFFCVPKYAILQVGDSTLSPRFFIDSPSCLQTSATPRALYASVVWKPDNLPDRPKLSSGFPQPLH